MINNEMTTLLDIYSDSFRALNFFPNCLGNFLNAYLNIFSAYGNTERSHCEKKYCEKKLKKASIYQTNCRICLYY